MTEGSPTLLLSRARRGNGEALGTLLGLYRSYLKLLVRVRNGRDQNRDPSDVVQDVFLKAHKGFGQFRGTTEAELAAWLRKILARCLADSLRQRPRDGQNPGVQNPNVRAIGAELDRSSHDWAAHLVSPRESPSQSAERREAAVLLAQALEKLPAQYREAIVLRQLEGLTSQQAAERMKRSVDSVRKLWARGMIELRQIMKGQS